MEIRKATLDDVSDIMTVYADAREYMKAQGNSEQWGDNYPDECLINKDIELGKCFVCMAGKKIGAVFYFAIENDSTYDVIEEGAWRNDRAYGVVHRIAVGKDMHGQGVARKCIAYAVEECRKHDIYDLRMDTHRDNVPMQRFLEK